MLRTSSVIRAILLVDHGSRRTAANRQLQDLAARLELALAGEPPETIVEHAHMELCQPDITAGFGKCVARGASHVVAVPCMLSRGRHVTEDIPRLLRAAADLHPGVSFSLAAPLAEQPSFVDVLRQAADGASPPTANAPAPSAPTPSTPTKD